MKLKLLVAMSSLLYLSQSCEAVQTGQTVLQITSQPIASLPELSNVQVITPEAAQTLSTTQTKVLSTAAISAATVMSGGWGNNGGGPTIYSKNYYYGLTLYPSGVVPANATITNVSWSYGVSSRPTGFQAILCNYNNGGALLCGDITSWGSGATSYFNGYSAATPMVYYFAVNGTGTLSPYVFGMNDSVSVTWTAP